MNFRLSRLAHLPGQAIQRIRRDQSGLSLVEVMVAAVLLVLGALAIFKLVDAAARSSYRAEQSQVVNNLLQNELERMKAAPKQNLAVNYGSSSGECFDRILGYFDPGDDPLKEYEGHSKVVPLSEEESFSVCEEVSVGDVTSTVFRMVTWVDPDAVSCEPPATPEEAYAEGKCGMKRITVIVEPETTAPGGERAEHRMQADVVAFDTGDASSAGGGS